MVSKADPGERLRGSLWLIGQLKLEFASAVPPLCMIKKI